MIVSAETNQPAKRRTALFPVIKRERLTARAKGFGKFCFAAHMLIGLGSETLADTIDVGQFVEAAGGQIESVAIMVERHPDGQTWTSNTERALQRFSPASSSKIPHALIALEQGLATPETVFPWDGIPRSVRSWNQDQTLRTAFEGSVVWVYQEIAQSAGRDTMSRALSDFSYGNMDVGSIDRLTTYWLDGTLQISAVEQVTFLLKLAREQLPLPGTAYADARNIMTTDADGNWVMRSKTGWFYSENDMDIGWFVGWLECTNETYVFALNMDMPDTRYLSKRKDIAYSVLEGIGAFDCD